MQDKDNKLIWEQYSTTDATENQSRQPQGTQQLQPGAITAEHLIYPNVLFGWEFEEDNVGDHGASTEYKHFVKPYFAAKRELQEDQMSYHDPDSGVFGANDIVVLMAGIDYTYVKDDSEMVVILSDISGEIGFYVDSNTVVRLDDTQVNNIVRSDITWQYNNDGKTASISVGRELTNKYDDLLRSEGDDSY